MNYRPGDYACVDTIYPFWQLQDFIPSKAIQLFTHSKYCHTFVIVSEDGDIVEARPKGAAKSHISEYGNDPIIYSSTILTDEQRKDIVSNSLSYIGTPYGFLDIAYLGLYTQGIHWNWLLQRVLNQHRMICSQLVATAGLNARTPVTEWLCGRPDPQLVTPGDLALLAAF